MDIQSLKKKNLARGFSTCSSQENRIIAKILQKLAAKHLRNEDEGEREIQISPDNNQGQ